MNKTLKNAALALSTAGIVSACAQNTPAPMLGEETIKNFQNLVKNSTTVVDGKDQMLSGSLDINADKREITDNALVNNENGTGLEQVKTIITPTGTKKEKVKDIANLSVVNAIPNSNPFALKKLKSIFRDIFTKYDLANLVKIDYKGNDTAHLVTKNEGIKSFIVNCPVDAINEAQCTVKELNGTATPAPTATPTAIATATPAATPTPSVTPSVAPSLAPKFPKKEIQNKGSMSSNEFKINDLTVFGSVEFDKNVIKEIKNLKTVSDGNGMMTVSFTLVFVSSELAAQTGTFATSNQKRIDEVSKVTNNEVDIAITSSTKTTANIGIVGGNDKEEKIYEYKGGLK